ncbi:uncharacterized protein Z520_11761 [Fonsecaea multimorphosa CBS 102226]|uniref:F-box domain-containing protein n=1 Tax=Fonsecaea multimorphosa CBS 102226 TaxID=1442371 RepID=A0A0D2GSY3_9EURO|nr:uncharacterized protein Z520_11761 [Fonsecaea multimorphosa CBS 102226]KIX92585.1 hypothetical protein Z520_11761 [Fonsecaea multimorphosa CBS 102226]OAL17392.1 hypothetical protein AYO22_11703 [Fonsecaea multimorphosa]
MAQRQSDTPVQLPTEIWAQVIELLDSEDPKDVRCLRQTCRRLLDLCDPAFCKVLHVSRPELAGIQEASFRRHPQRYGLVRTMVVHPQGSSASSHITVRGQGLVASSDLEKMISLIPEFRELRTLHVCTIAIHDDVVGIPRVQDYLDTHACSVFHRLNQTMLSSAFTELRECTLLSMQYHPIWINPILWAPKLISLKVSFPTIDEQHEFPLPPPKSTPLKHLTLLVTPFTDPQIVSSILSIPTALESLAFDDSRAQITSSQGILAEVLPALALHQPQLQTLKVHAARKRNFSLHMHTSPFDFTQLTGLKELSFSNHENCPINCFLNLPAGLETLRLNNEVLLFALAERLLPLSSAPNFTCPRHIEIDIDLNFHPPGDRPQRNYFYSWRREELMGEIDELMMNLPCQSITHTKRANKEKGRVLAKRTNDHDTFKTTAVRILLCTDPELVNGHSRNDLWEFHQCGLEREPEDDRD